MSWKRYTSNLLGLVGRSKSDLASLSHLIDDREDGLIVWKCHYFNLITC